MRGRPYHALEGNVAQVHHLVVQHVVAGEQDAVFHHFDHQVGPAVRVGRGMDAEGLAADPERLAIGGLDRRDLRAGAVGIAAGVVRHQLDPERGGAVLGLPDHVGVGDDGGARPGFQYRLVAEPVVAVHVGVEHMGDRFVGRLAQLRHDHAAGLHAGTGIDHDDAVVRDDPGRVVHEAPVLPRRYALRAVDDVSAGTDLLGGVGTDDVARTGESR